ncbi:MAG: tyrosine-type recombinase/integrase [archaeon]
MKKDGYAEQTIKYTGNRLKMLAKSVNLDKPEEIKEYIANKNGKNSYKEAIADAYARYVKYNELTWKKPIYHRASQPPYVPTEEEVTILISNAGQKYAMILSILRDTGMRPIELHRSTLRWYDLQRGLVNVETAKHGAGRTLQLKPQTLAMLKDYVSKHEFRLNDHPFPKVISMNKSLQRIRNRAAKKLQRPELRRICLYSFRHYFATMLYHKTKDILHVKGKMGHRNLKNTLIYTHLVNFKNDEYTVKAVEKVNEACKLIEAGFEYVTEMGNLKLFRKRK